MDEGQEGNHTEDVPADKRTLLLVRDVGNSIHPSIQIEVDFPSKHETSCNMRSKSMGGG